MDFHPLSTLQKMYILLKRKSSLVTIAYKILEQNKIQCDK